MGSVLGVWSKEVGSVLLMQVGSVLLIQVGSVLLNQACGILCELVWNKLYARSSIGAEPTVSVGASQLGDRDRFIFGSCYTLAGH